MLWSRDSVASEWVKTEAREGKARGILIPILIEEANIPHEFRHIQAANLMGWDPEAPRPDLNELLLELKQLLAKPVPPVAAGEHVLKEMDVGDKERYAQAQQQAKMQRQRAREVVEALRQRLHALEKQAAAEAHESMPSANELGKGKPPRKRNGKPPDRAEAGEEVDCTVYAPVEASPGNGFLVQVFAHLPEQAATLEEVAKEAEPEARKRAGSTLQKEIKRGSELMFNLTMPGLEIDEPSQCCIWRGKPATIQFGVTVPKDSKPKDLYGTVIVCESSVPVGHLKFKFRVVLDAAAPAPDTERVLAANLIRYKQAFISYASADRPEVLKRVQMLNASKVNFFQDLLTLEPGDRWEEHIYQYIDRSDVFYLFWSKAASESVWVKKEIEYAKKRQAGNDEAPPEIVPIIIEGPPPAKPPVELNFLHFNDKFMYFINSKEGGG